MNTSIKIRAVALVAAAFVTLGGVDLIAAYAYPATAPLQVASTAR
jgi:hypothetical protein